jgi:hypothetical protein
MAVSGGGGFVGAAGAVNVTLLTGDTIATIEPNVRVNPDRAGAGALQSVSVSAADRTTSFTLGGGLGVGFVVSRAVSTSALWTSPSPRASGPAHRSRRAET